MELPPSGTLERPMEEMRIKLIKVNLDPPDVI